MVITPVFVLLIDLVAAAPADVCPYDGELDEVLVADGEGTAFLSLEPFSRVPDLEGAVSDDPALPGPELPVEPPLAAPPALEPPPPPEPPPL
ncbi:hypothetical protein [Tardiphaga sp.]|uniref:hypothetical protein n=1 Tax=Tardiphaga sp. TaxID=1926292 RepID=UPI0037D9C11D